MLTIEAILSKLKNNYYLIVDYETNNNLQTTLEKIIPNCSLWGMNEFLKPFSAKYDAVNNRWLFNNYENAKNALETIEAHVLALKLVEDENKERVEDCDYWNVL